MNTQSPMPKDHPLMIAWEAYKKTPDFANVRKWALHEEHVDGSLWAAYAEGWQTAWSQLPPEQINKPIP